MLELLALAALFVGIFVIWKHYRPRSGWYLRWQIKRGKKAWGRQREPAGGVRMKGRAVMSARIKRAGSEVWEDLGTIWKGRL